MLHVWFEALNHPVGVKVQSFDLRSDQQRLYRARAKSDVPELKTLRIVIAKDDELWIVHEKFFDGNQLNASKIRSALEENHNQHL